MSKLILFLFLLLACGCDSSQNVGTLDQALNAFGFEKGNNDVIVFGPVRFIIFSVEGDSALKNGEKGECDALASQAILSLGIAVASGGQAIGTIVPVNNSYMNGALLSGSNELMLTSYSANQNRHSYGFKTEWSGCESFILKENILHLFFKHQVLEIQFIKSKSTDYLTPDKNLHDFLNFLSNKGIKNAT